MAHLPKNLPAILRSAGLKVEEVPGWYGRGRPGSFTTKGGVNNHHTGSYDGHGDPANDRAYARWLAIEGRSDLPAPLCQLALSAEGVVYICASGRANHAGKAKAFGSMAGGDGNALYIGIEAMNSGSQGWGRDQYEAYVLLNAVLAVKVTGNSVRTIVAHKETSLTGKWDPGKMDMAKFRRDVDAKMKELRGATPKPTPSKPKPAPKVFDRMDPESYFGGVKGSHVSWLMGRLIAHGVTKANGKTLTTRTTQYGPTAKAAVAAFQRRQGWRGSDADGLPGTETLKRLAANAPKPKPTPAPKPTPQPSKFTSDATVVVANVKSNPLMKQEYVRAEYERAFKGAVKVKAQAVMLNEYVDSYKSALFTIATREGYKVVEQGGLAVAYRDNDWDPSGASYAKIVGGVAHVSPNRGVLKVGSTTPGGTRFVFDDTMFPRGWNNPKYAQHKTTHAMGVKLAKGIGNHVRNQTTTLNSAAIVAGDMNQTGRVDWKGLTGLSPAAYAIQSGAPLDKMMQAYLFIPKGWTGKVVASGTLGKRYTDHGVLWVHFQITRPA